MAYARPATTGGGAGFNEEASKRAYAMQQVAEAAGIRTREQLDILNQIVNEQEIAATILRRRSFGSGTPDHLRNARPDTLDLQNRLRSLGVDVDAGQDRRQSFYENVHVTPVRLGSGNSYTRGDNSDTDILVQHFVPHSFGFEETQNAEEAADLIFEGKRNLNQLREQGVLDGSQVESRIQAIRQNSWEYFNEDESALLSESVIAEAQRALERGHVFNRDIKHPWLKHDYSQDSLIPGVSSTRMAGSPWFREQLDLLGGRVAMITDQQMNGLDNVRNRTMKSVTDDPYEHARAVSRLETPLGNLDLVIKGIKQSSVKDIVPGRVVSERLDQVIENPPNAMVDVQFGWRDDAGRMYHGQLPADIRPPMGMMAGTLKKELPNLFDEMGLQENDLVVNHPIGVHQGDYRRAMSYAKQGFGPVEGDNFGQLARINAAGGLSPELLMPADPQFAAHFRRLAGRRG